MDNDTVWVNKIGQNITILYYSEQQQVYKTKIKAWDHMTSREMSTWPLSAAKHWAVNLNENHFLVCLPALNVMLQKFIIVVLIWYRVFVF